MLKELQEKTGLRMAVAPFEVAERIDGSTATILDAHGGIVCQLTVRPAADELCDLLNTCAEWGGLGSLWASGPMSA